MTLPEPSPADSQASPKRASGPPLVPNSLGKASLTLGIVSIILLFSVGLCAGVAKEQGWLPAVGVLLFLAGGTLAFAGAIGGLLGFLGLFGRNRSRAAAIAGLLLSVLTVLLFAAIVQNAQAP
ncbi:hypothetical protein [Lignipirellula cremea]|uniref:Uncharacterized protein n=1 Tax=Lignipirellula cremea TaxID=2528010 RepID=A0A518DUJ1_9BACT|nr:hypothetical protein [Lignipirellula cremea]QDU95505.1 hypothetical protein Pla8534_33200 [Lignipirellula cremea]